MDIRQWLENTADREPPGHPNDNNIPEDIRKHRPNSDQVGQGYRYKRKRASSDSSIIVPNKSRFRRAQASTRAPSLDRTRQAQDADRALRRENDTRVPISSQGDAPLRTYERKFRHKTRPDRYEPKARKQKAARDTGKEKKSQKRRRSHRVDDGARTTGLVQSFQLKNGPKNNRLTLKPDASAGLFKHGRASMQMTGKGGGLPDLTFNEMRFLQKPTEHQDSLQRAEESQDSRAKDQRLNQGAEISTYFNAKTAVVAERAETGNDRREASRRGSELPAQSGRSREVEETQPLVELPGRPFLGFGSKGARPLSNDINDQGTSYYSWSDTAQRPSSRPSKRQTEVHAVKVQSNRQCNPKDGLGNPRGGYRTAEGKTGVTYPHEDPDPDPGQGTWMRKEQGSIQAVVEVYKPPKSRRPRYRGDTPAIQTTSQSLPRHPLSPPQFHEWNVNEVLAEPQDQHRYHTSNILKIRGRMMEDVRISPQSYLLDQHMDQNKENQYPESSLSIDKAIWQARATLQTQHSVPQPSIQAPNPSVTSLPHIRRLPSINNRPKMHQVDTVHKVRKFEVSPSKFKFARPFPHQRPSSGHHRPLSAVERKHWETQALDTLALRIPQMNPVQSPVYVDEDDEMLDNAADEELAAVFLNNASMDGRYDDNVPYDRHLTPHSRTFEPSISGAGYRPSVSVLSEQQFLGSAPVRGLSTEHDSHGERADGRQVDQVDGGLAGFWKPNRLY